MSQNQNTESSIKVNGAELTGEKRKTVESALLRAAREALAGDAAQSGAAPQGGVGFSLHVG